MSKWIIVRTTLVIKPHCPPSKCQPRPTDLYLKEAELVQSFLEFDFNRRRRRTGQEINQLHLTRIHRDGFWMREFVIDDPFRPVGESDRKSTRLNSSHVRISYAVFCLKNKRSWSDNPFVRVHHGPRLPLDAHLAWGGRESLPDKINFFFKGHGPPRDLLSFPAGRFPD